MHLESRRRHLCPRVTRWGHGAAGPSGRSPQASDARRALEETMALSTQSLASVTYQVSSLASAFLRLLDLQAAELRQLEATVGCVAQVGPSGGLEGLGTTFPTRGPRHP